MNLRSYCIKAVVFSVDERMRARREVIRARREVMRARREVIRL
jgi:hypothetical protein